MPTSNPCKTDSYVMTAWVVATIHKKKIKNVTTPYDDSNKSLSRHCWGKGMWVCSCASSDLFSKCICILVYARLLISDNKLSASIEHTSIFVHIITISVHIGIANQSFFFNAISKKSHKHQWMETGIFMWQDTHKHRNCFVLNLKL